MRNDSDGLENKTLLQKVQVIYEDSRIVVINKPSGLSVHGDGFRSGITLVDWIHEHYPEMVGVGEEAHATHGAAIERPGIVHRLDKDTSGVMILARTSESYAFLKQQFMGRTVSKEYRAIVYGVPDNDSGTIDAPIGKSTQGFRRRSARSPIGVVRDAVTEYIVREKFGERLGAPGGYALLSVFPKTGRMHQIRVHMAHIKHPVVCDSLYVPHRECPVEMGRLALHAANIELEIDMGDTQRFEAPLPSDMVVFIESLRRTS